MQVYEIVMNQNVIKNIYFILFSLIPLSIIIGPTISLINILLIAFFYVFQIIINKDYEFIKKPIFKILIFLYIYLIFNSLISIDLSSGIFRNFGFLRFIFLFLALNYFFYKFNNSNKIFNIWLVIVAVLIVDSYVEFFLGKNSLGFEHNYGRRLVSFFKDEPIVGAFINGFIFILSGYLLQNFKNKNIKIKILIFITLTLFLICVLLTGERSNTIKIYFGFFIFFYLWKYFSFKFKIINSILFILLISFVFYKSDFLKLRYGGQLFLNLASEEKRNEFYQNNLYFSLYKSGIEVFKNYPFLGVGNKNYRIETCDVQKYETNKTYLCSTHPHQIYIEFLAEHGLLGTAVVLILLFYLIFKNLKIYLESENLLQLGCFIYLLMNFLPLLPSGSFFNDFNLTLFWLNFSLMYACNKKTNFFQNKNELT